MDMQIQPIVDGHSAQASMPEPPPRVAAAARARTKHGLYSQYAVVPGESREAFLAFRHDMLTSLQPVSLVEAAVAEQMVMAQWKLQRLWATETGVYLAYEDMHPNKGASHPVRLSAVMNWDCMEEDRQLDRLSLQQQRLVNIFHKGIAKLTLMQDQRSKGLTRPQGRFEPSERVQYVAAVDSAPPSVLAEPPASPSNDAPSAENASRGETAVGAAPVAPPDAPPSATAPVTPATEQPTEAEPASPPATASPDSGSAENADPGESVASAAPVVAAAPASPTPAPPPTEGAPPGHVYRDAPLDEPHLGPDDIPGQFAPPMTRREIQRLESTDNRWRAAVNRARVR